MEKNSDGGIFEQSVMGQKLEAGALNIPNNKNLPGQYVPAPYTVCPRSVRTVFIKNTRRELFSKFHSFYSK
jgi:hypothetical protein